MEGVIVYADALLLSALSSGLWEFLRWLVGTCCVGEGDTSAMMSFTLGCFNGEVVLVKAP